MTSFLEIVDRTRALLQERGRVTLRALQREFSLDDGTVADLAEELVALGVGPLGRPQRSAGPRASPRARDSWGWTASETAGPSSSSWSCDHLPEPPLGDCDAALRRRPSRLLEGVQYVDGTSEDPCVDDPVLAGGIPQSQLVHATSDARHRSCRPSGSHRLARSGPVTHGRGSRSRSLLGGTGELHAAQHGAPAGRSRSRGPISESRHAKAAPHPRGGPPR